MNGQARRAVVAAVVLGACWRRLAGRPSALLKGQDPAMRALLRAQAAGLRARYGVLWDRRP